MFSIFANGGKKITSYFIDKIVLPNGDEINFPKKSKIGDYLSQWFGKDFVKRRIHRRSRIAFMVNDILKEAATRGTGRKIQQLGRKDFAGKTSTSNDAESTWFTGLIKYINHSLVWLR